MKLIRAVDLTYTPSQPVNTQGVTFRLNRKVLAIELLKNGRWFYDIDLERCRNSAELLDCILQIAGKDNSQFFTPAITGDLIRFLEDTAFEVFGTDLQGLYCPFGQSREVDWKTAIRKPKRTT